MSCNENFYNFVNHDWLKNNEIPKGHSRWGTFNEIDKENKDKLLSLINDISEKDEEGLKVKVLFEQYLNRKSKLSDVIEQVDSFLSQIRKFESKKELNKFICKEFYTCGISTPLMFSVDTDLDDSSINILHISSSGLGLPDRDYYFEKKHKTILTEYTDFMINILNYLEILIIIIFY